MKKSELRQLIREEISKIKGDVNSKIEDYFNKYSNENIKDLYQTYIEEGNVEIPLSINEDEGFIIFAYTADNTLFAKEPYKTALYNVLKKMPKYSGYVYGAHNLKLSKNTITLNHILSTTTDESLIQDSDFHYTQDGRKLYKIKVKTGVSINDISLYGDQESEVLLLPGTKLQLIGEYEDYIILKQIS